MLTDPFDQQLADLLKAARPGPPPGWRSHALAALASVRPRRHPNLVTIIVVAALILLLAAGLFAAVRHFFYVEGTLQFRNKAVSWLTPEESEGHRTDSIPPNAMHILSGELDWEVYDVPPYIHPFDISSSGEVLFWRGPLFPSPRKDIARAKLDGSEEVNLTQIAGLGGLNWDAKWSPDGSMIAFEHGDPAEGQPCYDVTLHVWVMNADGTCAHRVTPEGTPATSNPSWSPDGSRLLMEISHDGEWQCNAVTSDIWGTDIRPLPNVGHCPVWSPDGSMIASLWAEEKEVDGESGLCNQLLLTNADGSDPRVLVEQFIVYAEVQARYPTDAMIERDPGYDWLGDVIGSAGPHDPTWSPRSEMIAFLAALPLDPDGPDYQEQVEVWAYDVNTGELIRVTDDDVEQTSLHWK